MTERTTASTDALTTPQHAVLTFLRAHEAGEAFTPPDIARETGVGHVGATLDALYRRQLAGRWFDDEANNWRWFARPTLDNCPTCGRRITDTDDAGLEALDGQRWCITHAPAGVIDPEADR